MDKVKTSRKPLKERIRKRRRDRTKRKDNRIKKKSITKHNDIKIHRDSKKHQDIKKKRSLRKRNLVGGSMSEQHNIQQEIFRDICIEIIGLKKAEAAEAAKAEEAAAASAAAANPAAASAAAAKQLEQPVGSEKTESNANDFNDFMMTLLQLLNSNLLAGGTSDADRDRVKGAVDRLITTKMTGTKTEMIKIITDVPKNKIEIPAILKSIMKIFVLFGDDGVLSIIIDDFKNPEVGRENIYEYSTSTLLNTAVEKIIKSNTNPLVSQSFISKFSRFLEIKEEDYFDEGIRPLKKLGSIEYNLFFKGLEKLYDDKEYKIKINNSPMDESEDGKSEGESEDGKSEDKGEGGVKKEGAVAEAEKRKTEKAVAKAQEKVEEVAAEDKISFHRRLEDVVRRERSKNQIGQTFAASGWDDYVYGGESPEKDLEELIDRLKKPINEDQKDPLIKYFLENICKLTSIFEKSSTNDKTSLSKGCNVNYDADKYTFINKNIFEPLSKLFNALLNNSTMQKLNDILSSSDADDKDALINKYSLFKASEQEFWEGGVASLLNFLLIRPSYQNKDGSADDTVSVDGGLYADMVDKCLTFLAVGGWGERVKEIPIIKKDTPGVWTIHVIVMKPLLKRIKVLTDNWLFATLDDKGRMVAAGDTSQVSIPPPVAASSEIHKKLKEIYTDIPMTKSDVLKDTLYFYLSRLLLTQYIPIIEEMYGIFTDYIDFNNKRNRGLHIYISELVHKNASKKILSYLSIRNDATNPSLGGNPKLPPNERFTFYLNNNTGLHLDRKHDEILIKYNNTRDQIYPPPSEGGPYTKWKPNKYADKYNVAVEEEEGEDGVKVEDGEEVKGKIKNYLFGKYTDIFYSQKNEDIVEKMKPLVDYLANSGPVFMIGYGASGAGKTSTLIHFAKGNNGQGEDGVLIKICEEMGKRDYISIAVLIKEYYQTNHADNPSVGCDTFDENIFNKMTGGLVIDKSEKRTIICTTPKGNVTEDGVLFSLNDDNSFVAEDPRNDRIHKYREGLNLKPGNVIKLGQYIVDVVDQDRLVKATTNNPQSSRSHSLVYLKFIHKDPDKNSRYLFLGDFAGVENKFPCGDIKTVKEFLTKKVDGSEDELKDKKAQAPRPSKTTNSMEQENDDIITQPFYSYMGKTPNVDRLCHTGKLPKGKCDSREHYPKSDDQYPIKYDMANLDPTYNKLASEGFDKRSPDYFYYTNEIVKPNPNTLELFDFGWTDAEVENYMVNFAKYAYQNGYYKKQFEEEEEEEEERRETEFDYRTHISDLGTKRIIGIMCLLIINNNTENMKIIQEYLDKKYKKDTGDDLTEFGINDIMYNTIWEKVKKNLKNTGSTDEISDFNLFNENGGENLSPKEIVKVITDGGDDVLPEIALRESGVALLKGYPPNISDELSNYMEPEDLEFLFKSFPDKNTETPVYYKLMEAGEDPSKDDSSISWHQDKIDQFWDKNVTCIIFDKQQDKDNRDEDLILHYNEVTNNGKLVQNAVESFHNAPLATADKIQDEAREMIFRVKIQDSKRNPNNSYIKYGDLIKVEKTDTGTERPVRESNPFPCKTCAGDYGNGYGSYRVEGENIDPTKTETALLDIIHESGVVRIKLINEGTGAEELRGCQHLKEQGIAGKVFQKKDETTGVDTWYTRYIKDIDKFLHSAACIESNHVKNTTQWERMPTSIQNANQWNRMDALRKRHKLSPPGWAETNPVSETARHERETWRIKQVKGRQKVWIAKGRRPYHISEESYDKDVLKNSGISGSDDEKKKIIKIFLNNAWNEWCLDGRSYDVTINQVETWRRAAGSLRHSHPTSNHLRGGWTWTTSYKAVGSGSDDIAVGLWGKVMDRDYKTENVDDMGRYLETGDKRVTTGDVFAKFKDVLMKTFIKMTKWKHKLYKPLSNAPLSTGNLKEAWDHYKRLEVDALKGMPVATNVPVFPRDSYNDIMNEIKYGYSSGLADEQWEKVKDAAVVKKKEFFNKHYAIGLIEDNNNFFKVDKKELTKRINRLITEEGLPEETIFTYEKLEKKIKAKVDIIIDHSKDDILFKDYNPGDPISYINLNKDMKIMRSEMEVDHYNDPEGAVKQFFRFLIFGEYGHNCDSNDLEHLKKIIKYFIEEITDKDIYKSYLDKKMQTLQAKYNTYLGIGKEKRGTDIIKNPNTEQEKNMLINTIHLCQCYLDSLKNRLIFGKKVCENREIEGKFINKSLEQIRSTLKLILTDKNKDSDFTVPNYPSSSCGSYYAEICGEGCYDINSKSPLQEDKDKGTETYSLIMGDIFKYYFTQEGLRDPSRAEELTIKAFHKNLLISVFCVANFSPYAHYREAPPSPYIDISELKIKYVNWLDDKDSFKVDLIANLSEIDKRIEYYNEKNNQGNINRVNKDLMWKEKSQEETDPDKEAVLNHIMALDNNNAVSTMGSLEFLDKISKFYITDIVCKPDKGDVDRIKEIAEKAEKKKLPSPEWYTGPGTLITDPEMS